MSERISVNPQIHFGKPCIAGSRIPVQSILELVREGVPFAGIIHDYYPDLDPKQAQRPGETLVSIASAALW